MSDAEDELSYTVISNISYTDGRPYFPRNITTCKTFNVKASDSDEAMTLATDLIKNEPYMKEFKILSIKNAKKTTFNVKVDSYHKLVTRERNEAASKTSTHQVVAYSEQDAKTIAFHLHNLRNDMDPTLTSFKLWDHSFTFV